MKLDARDFKSLQWSITFLVIMGLVGGGSVWISLRMKADGEKAAKEATIARSQIQSKLSRARVEEQELRGKIASFEALRSRGYIGPERRLDWIEAIARIKSARNIDKLDYDFSPQRPIEARILPGGATAGGFEIMSSQMQMRVHLLHEGELLALLADLRNTVQALIQVRECTFERLAADDAARGNNAQLKVACTLEWITLREAK